MIRRHTDWLRLSVDRKILSEEGHVCGGPLECNFGSGYGYTGIDLDLNESGSGLGECREEGHGGGDGKGLHVEGSDLMGRDG